MTDSDIGHVTDQHRFTGVGSDDDIGNVLGLLRLPRNTHQPLSTVALNKPGTPVIVVGADGVDNIAAADAHCAPVPRLRTAAKS